MDILCITQTRSLIRHVIFGYNGPPLRESVFPEKKSIDYVFQEPKNSRQHYVLFKVLRTSGFNNLKYYLRHVDNILIK